MPHLRSESRQSLASARLPCPTPSLTLPLPQPQLTAHNDDVLEQVLDILMHKVGGLRMRAADPLKAEASVYGLTALSSACA